MSRYLDGIDSWPQGTPLPPQTLLLVSVDGLEYRVTPSQVAGSAGGATYRNIRRPALQALVLAEDLQPGLLYVVSGRTASQPLLAVAAASVSQLSAHADQLEADGTVTAGSYDVATDEFTAGTGGGAPLLIDGGGPGFRGPRTINPFI